jgi:hypothetical protein
MLRFSRAQRPDTRWASLGAALIVVFLGRRLAPFQALGHLRRGLQVADRDADAPLVLTSYVFVSAALFLAGAQLDELLRKQRSA